MRQFHNFLFLFFVKLSNIGIKNPIINTKNIQSIINIIPQYFIYNDMQIKIIYSGLYVALVYSSIINKIFANAKIL